MVTEPCARCGGKQVRPASLWERLRSWFVDGGGLAQLQVCAGCGAPRGRGSWTTRYRRVDRSWWRVPAQLLRAVRRERTWEPVPVFYTLVGAAVAVPTAVGAGLVRPRRAWRWPLGAAGVAVGATFVLSLASSVRGGQAARAIRRTLAPERALAEDLERQAATIRDHAAEQPVFVPDTWDGPVAFGGHGISDPDGEPRLTSLSVVAGSGATIGEWPWLRIEVRYEPWLPVEVVEEELVTEVASSEPSQQVDVEGLDLRESTDRERLEAVWAARERRQQARERELSQRWVDGTLVIDGQRVAARRLDGDGVQAAVVTHAGRTVSVVGAGVELDRIALVATTDIEPLLDGMRHRHRGMLG